MTFAARALPAALRLARQAGDLLRRGLARRRSISFKGHSSNLVTDMDRASEALIVRGLRRAFPDHEIVAEERGRVGSGARARWFIDPLDGTTNYAHGLPLFCVSIGLEVGGVLEAGVVHAPMLDETFTAIRGRGARRNGRPVRCSRQADLRGALLCTGFPYRPKYRVENLRFWNAFIRRAQAVRRLGSAALDICWTAAGVFDGFWEFRLGPWDLAAGVLVAAESGATVTDFRGGPVDLWTGEVLIANPRLHAAMRRVLADRSSSLTRRPVRP